MKSSKEQQISQRIAALRNELEEASKPPEKASTMEQLQQDLRRRQESYIRRERQYQDKIKVLEEEVDRLKAGRRDWMEQDEKVRNIREMHQQLMQNVEHVQQKTAKVLKDQEKDLLRAFRARLFDIQSELELEKNKADVGASGWIEKNRQLERGLDWAKEMADRLERVNQALQHENGKLKSQYKTQENDREFLIRQLVAVKKDNVQIRQELEQKEDEMRKLQEEVDALSAFKKQSLQRTSTSKNLAVGGPSPSKRMSIAEIPQTMLGGGIANGNGEHHDHEARYKEIIRRLKKLLDTERTNLKKVRAAYSADLQCRTELEVMLRQCVADVQRGLSKQRRAVNQTSSRELLGTPEPSSRGPGEAFEAKAFGERDREKVIELLLSQERVISMLYRKTFPASKGAPTGLDATSLLSAPSLSAASAPATTLPALDKPDLESIVASRAAQRSSS